MKTLIKMIRLNDGYELWYRVEGFTNKYIVVTHRRKVR